MIRPDPSIYNPGNEHLYAKHIAEIACLYRWGEEGSYAYCIHDKECKGCIDHARGHAEMTCWPDQYKILEMAYKIKNNLPL